jgi:hypothetical protein
VQNFFETIKTGWTEGQPTGLEGEQNDSSVLIYGQATKKKRYKLSFNRHLYLFFSKAFIAPRGRESLGLYLGEDLC